MKELIRTFSAGRCPICSTYTEELFCASCAAPHCKDCWHYNAGCGVFGCYGRVRVYEPIGELTGVALQVQSALDEVVTNYRTSREQRQVPRRGRQGIDLDGTLLVVILFMFVIFLLTALIRPPEYRHRSIEVYRTEWYEAEDTMDAEDIDAIKRLLKNDIYQLSLPDSKRRYE